MDGLDPMGSKVRWVMLRNSGWISEAVGWEAKTTTCYHQEGANQMLGAVLCFVLDLLKD